MIQPSHLRFLLPLSIFVSVIFVGACGSSAPNEQTNKAIPNQPSPTAQPSSAAATKAKLNLNEGSETEFMAIPGMTKRMTHEFEEYRPYQSIQQFRKEMAKYVSPTVIADYEKYVYVPISQNGADAATLQQIPGLDAAEAEALIKARPYASPEAFLDKLSSMLTQEELAVAKTYLR